MIDSLTDLPSKAIDLPEVQSSIEVITAQLKGQVLASDRQILSADVESFLVNLATISDALSARLSIMATYLCKLVDPSGPPIVDELALKATSLYNDATHTLPQDLHTAQVHLTNTLSTLLSTHLTFLTASIQVLEQTQHGALARHTKASAELLHTRTSVLSLQSKMHTFSNPPPPEFVAALREFKKRQGAGEKSLRDREGLAKEELDLYERAGVKGMRDLARRKDALVAEIDRTEAEIARLKRQ